MSGEQYRKPLQLNHLYVGDDRLLRCLTAGAICAALLSACQALEVSGGHEETGGIKLVYSSETGRLEQMQYRPGDTAEGQSWAYMDGARLLRVEVDQDGDGQIDRWEHYGAPPVNAVPGDAASALLAALERVEISTRRDGVVSRRESYEGGVLVRVEEDTNGNGRVDKWESYAGGLLETVALDTAGRGQPDRRFIYGGSGEVARVEIDPDGSGRFRPFSENR